MYQMYVGGYMMPDFFIHGAIGQTITARFW